MTTQQFVEELQRRHVFKVAGAYLVASWFAVEVSNTVFQILDKPHEWARIVLYLCAVGLPITLVLAWMFDFTKDGIVRTPRWVSPEERAAAEASGTIALTATPARGVVLSSRATGMFGLGAVVAIVSLAAYTRVARAPTAADDRTAADSTAFVNIRAIAVMPFEDISENHDQKYFADGMTEELLSRLAQVANLQIVSGQGYAGPARGGDLQSIADRLKVQAILEGSVRKAADSVRVSVKLINAATSQVLYVESFTRPTSNLFQVQDEIAAAVTNSLQAQTNTGVQASGNRGTTNDDAVEAYMQGMSSLEARTDDQLRRAIAFFNLAIKRDTNFAKAYAGLAQTYAVMPTVAAYSFEEAGTKGNAAAARAIELDPNLADAFAAMGQIAQNMGWNPAMAESSYKRAIASSKSYAPAHQWYAETLTMLGRTDEALREIYNALQLKPYSPAAKNTLGYVLTIRGDLDSALVVFRNEGALYPDYKLGHLTHALTALTAARYDEAEQAALSFAGSDAQLGTAMTTVIRGAAGKVTRPEAIRAAASLESKLGPGFTALWYGALRDDADAMKMVTKAYNAGNDANFPYFVIHPLLKSLHGMPQYRRIVSEMGIVPAK